MDVLAVKQLFLKRKPHPLPAELIDLIIDHAEYWPHTTSFPNPSCHANQDGNILVTRSLPLGYPDASVPVKFELMKEDYASGSQRFYPAKDYMGQNYESTTSKILEAWKKLSMPDTQLEHPCRKIVIIIRSHDQGWGGRYIDHGTYEGSFTWFDIGLQRLKGVDMSQVPNSVLGKKKEYLEEDEESDLYSSEEQRTIQEERFLMFHNHGTSTGALEGWEGMRFDLEQIDPPFLSIVGVEEVANWQRDGLNHPYLPHDNTLQRNLTATKEFTDHKITLRWDDNVDPESERALQLQENGQGKKLLNGELVRGLMVGDVVTVWARARFPGWCNIVEKCEVKVYWAV